MKTVINEWLNRVIDNPDKLCLKFEDNEFTRQQLEDISNNVAITLKQLQIGSGSRVALKLTRSEKIVFFVLGILKTGALYTFLDPGYPPERLDYMLEQVQPDLILSDNEADIQEKSQLGKVLLVDSFDFESKAEPINNSISKDTAYLMFTSGSTGRPKAVSISHENLITYLHSINELKKVSDNDICLHTASFSFSSSVRQLFVPLINGATLFIAKREDASNLRNLLQLVKRERITVIDTVQSLWRYGLQDIESLNNSQKIDFLHNNLRLMVFSGDILPNIVVSRINNLFDDETPEIINLYGQTETIGGVAYILPRDGIKHSGYVPIGKPLSHLKLVVLDENHQKKQDGEPGELYVSGNSLANEYYKNPELTQKLFVLLSIPGESEPDRFFKTGDIGKINENGDVEILGRSDFQVKIRGVRIELGEIESVLTEHPEISDAVVIAHQQKEGDKKLVGYYITEDDSNIVPSEVRNYLSRHLPEIMIPSGLLKMETFPLTPSGKINRKALPDPSTVNHKVEEDKMTNTEKHVWLLFRSLLNMDTVALTDNFFDLGGHSILVVQLVDKIEQILGKEVPASLVYSHPSVAQLSKELDRLETGNKYAPLVSLQPFGHHAPFFYVHGDDSNFVLPRILGESIPFYAFFHQGQDGSHLKYQTITSISTFYVEEMLKRNLSGPIVLGGYSIGGIVAFEMACQLQAKGYKIDKLILVDTLAPNTVANELKGAFLYNQTLDRFDRVVEDDLEWTNNKLNHPRFTDRVARKLTIIVKKIKTKNYERTGKIIPLELRNDYIMNIYRKARKHYKAGSFTGDVVLFRSIKDNCDVYDLGWQKFIQGNIEIHDIESDHQTIIKLPAIQKIGNILKVILENSSENKA